MAARKHSAVAVVVMIGILQLPSIILRLLVVILKVTKSFSGNLDNIPGIICNFNMKFRSPG